MCPLGCGGAGIALPLHSQSTYSSVTSTVSLLLHSLQHFQLLRFSYCVKLRASHLFKEAPSPLHTSSGQLLPLGASLPFVRAQFILHPQKTETHRQQVFWTLLYQVEGKQLASGPSSGLNPERFRSLTLSFLVPGTACIRS